MQIQLVRSATLRLEFAGQTWLVDPWLAPRGEGKSYAGERRSPLVELPFPVDDVISGIDAVLVSHLHSDHFDDVAHELLPKDVPLICAERDAAAIAQSGFTHVRAVTSELETGGAKITMVNGHHGPPEVREAMGEVSGFVFRAENEPVVYWAGDTIFCEAVRETIAEYRPDVIVVHACGADWNGDGPLVMDEPMVREVLECAPNATVIATHLDAVDHATVTRTALRDYFENHPELASRLLVPRDGETMAFG